MSIFIPALTNVPDPGYGACTMNFWTVLTCGRHLAFRRTLLRRHNARVLAASHGGWQLVDDSRAPR